MWTSLDAVKQNSCFLRPVLGLPRRVRSDDRLGHHPRVLRRRVYPALAYTAFTCVETCRPWTRFPCVWSWTPAAYALRMKRIRPWYRAFTCACAVDVRRAFVNVPCAGDPSNVFSVYLFKYVWHSRVRNTTCHCHDEHCTAHLNRDRNASVNIYRRYLERLSDTPVHTPGPTRFILVCSEGKRHWRRCKSLGMRHVGLSEQGDYTLRSFAPGS